MKKILRSGLMAALFLFATFIPVINVSAAEYGHNNIWATDGGKVAVEYYPSIDDPDLTTLDGTNFVPKGEIVNYVVGDEMTVKAQADTGYQFVGWFISDPQASVAENYVKSPVLSTETEFTYKPGITVIIDSDTGNYYILNYITAVFEKTAPKPRRTVVTDFIANPYDAEEVPYDTDLAEYTAGKKWNIGTEGTDTNNRWLELFGEVDGVWQYPAQTGLTYSFVEQEVTDTEIINKYTVTYDQVIVTRAAAPVEPSDDEPETPVPPADDTSKDAPSNAVKTGDHAQSWLFVGIASASLLCIVLALLIYRRRRLNR